MIVKNLKKAVARENFHGELLNINLKETRMIESKYSRDSYEYYSIIKLNDKCKLKSHDQLECLILDLRNTARYYTDLEGLKDYLGV